MPDALARNTDPESSHAAADSLDGKLSNINAAIVRVLRSAGSTGMTLDELVTFTGIDKVTVSPRLKPLEGAHWIERTERKRLGKHGRYQTVWVIL